MDGESAMIALVPDEFSPAELHIDNLDGTVDVGKDASPIAQHKATSNVGKIGQLRPHGAMPPTFLSGFWLVACGFGGQGGAGLERLPQTQIPRLPWMADFAAWVSACEPSLGLAAGAFLKAYEGSRIDAQSLALEVSPLYEPLRELAEIPFRGTTSDLLSQLNRLISNDTRRLPGWPRSPSALSNTLRRMAAYLRSAGIELEFNRQHGGKRIVSVRSSLIS